MKLRFLLWSSLLVFTGCFNWEASNITGKSFLPQDRPAQPSLEPQWTQGIDRLLKWGAFAKAQGFPQGLEKIRISPENRNSLGLLEVTFPEGQDLQKVLKLTDKPLEKPGAVSLPAFHFSAESNDPAPFFLAYLQWPEDRQAEWYFQELASLLLKTKGTPAQVQAARNTWAVHFTSLYLSSNHGGNQSLPLNYGAFVADRRIFSTLIRGLQRTLQDLRNTKDPAAALGAKFQTQIASWQTEFKTFYSQRFSTNEYLDWTHKKITWEEVLAQDSWAADQSTFDRKFRSLPEGVKSVVEVWNQLDPSPQAVESWLKAP